MLRRVEAVALQALLTLIAQAMALASRRSDRFRRQVTRDLLVEVRSDEGVPTSARAPTRCR